MTILLAIFGVFIACFTGFLIVSLLLTGKQNPGLNPLIRIFFGVAVGNGFYSLTAFAWQVLIGQSYSFYSIFELLFCGILCVSWLRQKRIWSVPASAAPRSPTSWFERLLSLSFVVASALGLLAFISGTLLFPHGSSDAWNIWNLGARFLFLGNASWTNAFSPLLLHSDYPLFWAVSVARVWRYARSADQIVPIIYSLLFLISVFGLVIASVRQFRGNLSGWLAGLILFCANALFILAPTQCVDIPLSLFSLSTLVLLYFYEHGPEKNLKILLMAGFTAAACAWIKNEGWLFFLVVSFVRFGLLGLFQRRFSRKELLNWSLGALPALAAALYFKLVFAPPNDLLSGMGAETLRQLIDPARYQVILMSFAIQLVNLDPKYSIPVLILPVIALVYGVSLRPAEKQHFFQSASLLVLLLAGYFLIYVTTPRDLEWHLTTSLNRLFLQLWPLMVFETAMLLRVPDVQTQMDVSLTSPPVNNLKISD